jgi:phytol kinase
MYLLARGNTIMYVIPLAVLTFADSAAAVVGLRYGVLKYSTEEGRKSTEGSVVFLIVAFLCTLVPLLLFTDTEKAAALLIAFLVAFVSMLVEAVCTRGADNILVPLVALLVLQSSVSRGTAELALQTVVACGMLVVVLVTRNRNTLSGSALLGTVLVGYLCWTFGGWQWLLAPLVVFVINAALHIDRSPQRLVTAHFSVVRRVSEAGLAWLFLAAMLHRDELIVPFVAAFCAQLAMLSMRQWRVLFPSLHPLTITLASVAMAWLVMFFPLLWLGVVPPPAIRIGIALLAVTLLAALIFYRKLAQTEPAEDTPRPWRTQGVCGGLASLLVLIPLYVS